MGVDLATYRGRIGVFVGHCCAGLLMQPSFNTVCTYSMLIRIFGVVSFVRMLLLIAGVEQNPGPDLFIFKYQYLLVNVGTEVLRKLFDKLTSNDAATYLNGKAADIQKLKVLTTTQKNLLPPVNNKPDTADFDITLLSCLLRNVCGLCPPKDTVWMDPDRADISIEADITRLRMCRNDLMHSDRLRLSAVELDAKWTNLCKILSRLNQKAGIAQLQNLIDSAERMVVDEDLWNEYNKIIKACEERDKLMDLGIGELKSEVSRVKHEVSDVKHEVSHVKHGVSDVKHEVSNVKLKVLDVKHEVSNVKHEVSDLKYEVSHELIGVKKKLYDVALSQQKAESQHVELTGDTESVSEKKTSKLGRLIRNLGFGRSSRKQDKTCQDVQEQLINFYKRHYKVLPVLPLFGKCVEDLLLVYESPAMHTVEEKKDAKEIKCFKDIFCIKKKSCNEIYITGDAGVGKTSFCQHLCFLWCNAKCGNKIEKEYKHVSKFDCVFYINLRDTEHYHVVDMIKECYFDPNDPIDIRNILRKSNCLVLLDGLDEWNPKTVGKKTHELPKRVYSESSIYLTTTRPYRIERLRLTKTDVDHQIQISGIQGKSLNSYIEKIVNYMNKLSSAERKSSDFQSDIKKCGLTNELVIPIIASQLVVLWYEKTLDGMTRPLLYANILEMLFQRAEQRKVMFPPHTASTLQLPGSLSGLMYLNKYVSLLYKVCHLSFCSMFKQDENSANLVFSRHQLQSEPFCINNEEIDFLCKIGILSTNEVFGFYPVEKLRISFIHKSYLEFFAALFISSFDSSNSSRDVTKTWKCLNDVVQFENIFLLLAGFSLNSIKTLFENIYIALSEDLTSCRKNVLFHYNNTSYSNSYSKQLKSLENIVVNCFKEVSRSNDKTCVLRMEDFLFDKYSKNVDILRKLLLLNTTNVKSLHCDKSEYLDEFDQIKNLQCINIVGVSSADFVKFTQCMLQNKSTLHTVCIQGGYNVNPLIPELPVRSLHHLTSLSLSHVKIQHNSLHYLVKFLSDNVLIENIKLSSVSCVNHQDDDDSDCTLTLNLPQHTKLTSLCLWYVNILCNNVNNSSLKSVTLFLPFSERIDRLCYNDLFNCLNYLQLEHLHINGFPGYMSDNKTLKTLTSTVKSLPCLKSLTLRGMKLPDDVLLQLHPQVTQVKIELEGVTMSRQCFHCFVESCVNKSEIKVELNYCDIRSVDGETHSVLSWEELEKSWEESVKYMSEHLESISTINITYKGRGRLDFETRSCQ